MGKVTSGKKRANVEVDLDLLSFGGFALGGLGGTLPRTYSQVAVKTSSVPGRAKNEKLTWKKMGEI